MPQPTIEYPATPATQGTTETAPGDQNIVAAITRIEHRGWQLWLIAIPVILALTLTVIATQTSQLTGASDDVTGQTKTVLFSLSALVVLFCLYVLHATSTLGKLKIELLQKEMEKAAVESLLEKVKEKSEELVQTNEKLEREILERNRAEERLHFVAHHDVVTALPNRSLFLDRLSQALIRLPWRKRQLAVLYLDLDHFKRVNDTLGHAGGDLLLKAVAERLKESVRGGDTVSRLGGDEFSILLADLARSEDAFTLAQKMLHSISAPFVIRGHELFMTASMGISLFPADGETADTLLKHADLAMYRAKEQGRNTYHLYSAELNVRARERLSMEAHIRRALERKEFHLHFQPKIDTTSGRIVGMEALARWQHPELGLIPPSKFIPIAEELGLILPLGEWVLMTACAQNKAWQEAGLPFIPMGVNISARQLQDKNIVQIIERTLRKTGLAPAYLELELTESIIQHPEQAAVLLAQLNLMGIQIAIDDFGTGYSSLNYLKRLPIHKLKIDQSFVRQLTIDPDTTAIVAAIITLAHSLELKTVAEGVETQAQLEQLAVLQCDEVQGYLFSPPVPAEEAAKLLARQ